MFKKYALLIVTMVLTLTTCFLFLEQSAEKKCVV